MCRLTGPIQGWRRGCLKVRITSYMHGEGEEGGWVVGRGGIWHLHLMQQEVVSLPGCTNLTIIDI